MFAFVYLVMVGLLAVFSLPSPVTAQGRHRLMRELDLGLTEMVHNPGKRALLRHWKAALVLAAVSVAVLVF
jgi:hypothetical protein